MTAYCYEIHVSEVLDSHWSRLFDGMQILPPGEDDAETGTRLTGRLVDQAALFGMLSQVRNLNLTLVGVRRIDPPE